MALFSATIEQIVPINLGTRKAPRYRVLVDRTIELLISQHEVSFTNKQMFGGTFVTSKMLEAGRKKFFDSIIRPVFDASVSDQTIQALSIIEGHENLTEFPLDVNRFDRIPASGIKAVRLHGSWLKESRQIELVFHANRPPLLFFVCAFTPWGVKDLPDAAKLFYDKWRKAVY